MQESGLFAPRSIAGIEIPLKGGFLLPQAQKIFADIHRTMAASELSVTDTLMKYLKTQGVATAADVMSVHRALYIPTHRRKNPFTEADKNVVSALIDITGRLNAPIPLPQEDLGPRESARDIGRGKLRFPRKR